MSLQTFLSGLYFARVQFVWIYFALLFFLPWCCFYPGKFCLGTIFDRRTCRNLQKKCCPGKYPEKLFFLVAEQLYNHSCVSVCLCVCLCVCHTFSTKEYLHNSSTNTTVISPELDRSLDGLRRGQFPPALQRGG